MNAKEELLSRQELFRLLDYDYETGVFTHKTKARTKNIGDVCGSPHNNGYIHMRINGINYLAHRLAFLYMTGKWPTEFVDHIDMNKRNNSWENLRESSRAGNSHNRSIGSTNKSGHKGVSWSKANRKWYAQISINGKKISLGYFNSIEDASLKVKEARDLYHREFARHQ